MNTVEQTAVAKRDRIFSELRERIGDFHFGRETAAVFDDMLNRSVPFYGEIQRMTGELVADFAAPNSNIYDLGCSTCNTFWAAAHFVTPASGVRFIGIDSSPEMLDKARAKLIEEKFPFEFELRRGDLNEGMSFENASVIILTLTLQFVRPLNRERLIRSIYKGLNDNGCLILVEKVLGEESLFNRLFIQHYYEMKRRNGYSEMEIMQKREALENVLVPYRLEENKQLLHEAGFAKFDTFFKWYNFSGMIAVK
jgi:tRNA (cmo5U34)-methyltransferase